MFNPVIDILKIKTLEKKIGRKITLEEIYQVHAGLDLILETKGGGYTIEKVSTYSLSDLMSDKISYGDIDFFEQSDAARSIRIQNRRSTDAGSENHAFDKKNIVILQREMFKPTSKKREYFERLSNCINEMHELGLKFENPTTEFIIFEHLAGNSILDIERTLKANENAELKVINRTAIGDRIQRFLKKNDITPYSFSR